MGRDIHIDVGDVSMFEPAGILKAPDEVQRLDFRMGFIPHCKVCPFFEDSESNGDFDADFCEEKLKTCAAGVLASQLIRNESSST